MSSLSGLSLKITFTAPVSIFTAGPAVSIFTALVSIFTAPVSIFTLFCNKLKSILYQLKFRLMSRILLEPIPWSRYRQWALLIWWSMLNLIISIISSEYDNLSGYWIQIIIIWRLKKDRDQALLSISKSKKMCCLSSPEPFFLFDPPSSASHHKLVPRIIFTGFKHQD